jgi:hypothetical protein
MLRISMLWFATPLATSNGEGSHQITVRNLLDPNPVIGVVDVDSLRLADL